MNNNTSTKILIILLTLLCVMVLAAGILYFGVRQKVIAVDNVEEEYTLPLEQFVVNLKANEDGVTNYLKTSLALMYNNKKDETILKENISKIRNIINNEIRVQSLDDMLDVKKTEKFKEKLIKALNEGLGKDFIKDIYITDIVVQ